ncbi:MAG TPA: lysophospholipid transporter LplT [Usitatibacter sp.]|jgi:MFS family permease|nr:lysophospholipid transporter LplT [Usitatibacter sp.]
MKRGFYTIMAAQFFSSLADNALLIAAIAMLALLKGPEWLTPLLKWSFTLSYVVLAFAVGAFADSMPKGRVMFVTNMIKVVGCGLILFNEFLSVGTLPPFGMILLAYAVVGLGAAAYSPAKYGILTELLPPEKLVVANAWIEGLTVLSIVMGNVVGGLLIGPRVSKFLLAFDFPLIDTSINTPPEAAVTVIALIYVVAALFNLAIPDTGARYPHQERNPGRLLIDFSRCFVMLWRDKLGQISLAVTTLFWGAGACLQFIVIKWAERQLRLPLEHAAMLSGVSAVGIAIGAILAARIVPLKRATQVLPVGIGMGIVVIAMVSLKWMPAVYLALILVGACAGFFVVPMNALLQHRGHLLMSAGHSIAVQNFNENVSILIMLAMYSLMIRFELRIHSIVVLFGLFLAGAMYLVMRWNAANHRADPNLDRLIGETKH